MFLSLLIVTFLIAALVSAIVARMFDDALVKILNRIIDPNLGAAWHRYVRFAIYVVGISGGVRVGSLEQYVNPRSKGMPALVLDADRWTLEVYRTILGTLQAIAWMLLVFFVVSLIAFVIVRGSEMRHGKTSG